MTPETQRIAIAEACGWTEIISTPYDPMPPKGREYKESNWGKPIPDYLNDLNAMHAAEKAIKAVHTYNEQLELVVLGYSLNGRDAVAEFMLRHATAAQRAEALLKTLNLWTE